jgi:zinc/manganese transport system permease protein
MSGILSIMVPAFVECLVLVGIHSYLGLHVIKRRVIFVDLALAQIAALGATVGFLFGMDPSSTAAFLFSMAFTFLGAAVFALSRLRNDRVPQEAVIGLVYALAAAVAILVIDKSPTGAEHIKDLLTGTILWVKWPEIIVSAVAYSLVGLVHYLLRHKFIRITEDPEGAFRDGMWVRLWDFLFYLSFGFVITFSVRTAGVLLVFVFLVAPAISAVLITDRWRSQLLIGWGLGTLVTVVALWLSYLLDVPSGPTVVAFYGVVLLLLALVVRVVRAGQRGHALGQLGVGLAITSVVVVGLWGAGKGLGASRLAHDDSHQASSSFHHEPEGEPGEVDPEPRLSRLREQVRSGAVGWKRALVDAVLDRELPLLYKQEALGLLRQKAGSDFGYDPEAADSSGPAQRMRAWAASR